MARPKTYYTRRDSKVFTKQECHTNVVYVFSPARNMAAICLNHRDQNEPWVLQRQGLTVDLHLDIPLDTTVVTAAASFIQIENAVNGVTWSDLRAGEDGDIVTAKVGMLLGEKFQPFAHYQTIMPDASGTEDTDIYGIGCNYYIKGPANKLTAEWSQVDYGDETVDILTFQAAFGF